MKKILFLAAALSLAVSGSVFASELPEADENGIIRAESWAETFPEIVESYNTNAENTYRVDYLEEDPYLTNVYEGYGFAKDYTSAVGHTYCLEDVSGTARPHALANCLTCKTADFTKLVNDLGEEAYSLDFEETFGSMVESVGCYNCHENEEATGTLVVTHDYVKTQLADVMDEINPSILACGQCHIEYYFKPETKAVSTPYTSVEEMTPEAMLAYYDSIDFADWTQESTGARLLKAQHPEFETYMNGSVHVGMGLSCASCHMEKAVSETGTEYTSHYWQSPLQSEALLETCAACHKDVDMAEKVGAIQAEITGREKEVGEKLSELKTALADAVAAGDYTEDELNELRSLYRSAQWYWDIIYVENSEGAHNSKLSRETLDKSETLIDEAMGLFKA